MVLFFVHRYFCSFGIRKLDKLFLRGGAPLYPIITAMYSSYDYDHNLNV